MRLGLQVSHFSWPGSPASIGPTFGRIARDAEAAGMASLWVMDHFFQIRGNGRSEEPMLDGMRELAKRAGCFACPEGGATLAALRALRASGAVAEGARVVIYNTGSGLKYPEAWRAALARRARKAVHA